MPLELLPEAEALTEEQLRTFYRLNGDRRWADCEEDDTEDDHFWNGTSIPGYNGGLTERRPIPLDAWKRDLLDMSSRNHLIKMRVGKRFIPLLVPDIVLLEGELNAGREFRLLARPSEWNGKNRYQKIPFETVACIGNAQGSLSEDIISGILHSPLNDSETEAALRSISRSAEQDLEESGCNTLFIQLGSLKWYDSKSDDASYAPLMLVPVEIKRTMEGFVIRMLDEGPYPNVTLQEKLKREFGISFPDPPEDGAGISSIMDAARQAISGMASWNVVESAGLGIFSFSQYVIWKDLESNIDDYRENPIVRSLLDGTWNEMEESGPDTDPCGTCLILPADGSQVKAVNASLDHSFVMHGPPGTGKSQTITNIIANAMMNGRTVLFVAEKRAALEVVKKRLDDAGVGNHCLELYSNKTTKSQVIAQLRNAFDASVRCNDGELKQSLERLERSKIPLDEYAEELHRPMVAGLSMYDLISRYEDFDVGVPLEIRFRGPVQSFTEETIGNLGPLVGDSAVIVERVADIDEKYIALIGTCDIGLTLVEETDRLIDALRSATEAWEGSLDRAMSMDMARPPLDFGRTGPFYSTLAGFDYGLVHDDARGTYPDRIRALNNAIADVSSGLRDLGIRWTDASPEAVSDLRSQVAFVRREYGHFIDGGYCSEDASVANLIDATEEFCDQLTVLREDLTSVGRVWNRRVFSRSDAGSLLSEYRDTKAEGSRRKRNAQAEFMRKYSSAIRDPSLDLALYGDTVSSIMGMAETAGRLVRLLEGDYSCEPVFGEVEGAFDAAVGEIRRKLEEVASDWCYADVVELNRLKALATKTKAVAQHLATGGYPVGSVDGLFDSAIKYCQGMLAIGDDLRAIDAEWNEMVFQFPDAGRIRSLYAAARDAGRLKRNKVQKAFLNSVSPMLRHSDTEFEDYAESIELLNKHSQAARRLIELSKAGKGCGPVFTGTVCPFDASVGKLVQDFRDCGEMWCGATAGDLEKLNSEATSLDSEYRYLVGIGYVAENPSFKELVGSVRTYCSEFESLRDRLIPIDRLWRKEVFVRPDLWNVESAYEGALAAGDRAEDAVRREYVRHMSDLLKDADISFDGCEETLMVIERVAGPARELSGMRTDILCNPVLDDVLESSEAIESFLSAEGMDQESLIACYAGSRECDEAESELEQRHREWKTAYQALSDLLKLDVADVPDPLSVGERSEWLCGMLEPVADRVHDIATWHNQERRLIENGLSELVPFVLQRRDAGTLINAAYRAFYRACLEYCRDSLGSMRMFGQGSFEEAIRRFRDYDMKHIGLNRDILKCRLCRNLPSEGDDIPGSETYILNRVVQTGRYGKSVRTLLSEIPNALMGVCPCFLMSPLSVSQYLGKGFDRFDLVIFDESSQMTTTKAICSLGRAKRAVIAGDNKQLPPTAFFRGSDHCGDDAVVPDSFLDDCLSLDMPEVYLEWHYRSRHESLIAFSNRTFYGNGMLTFPSSDDGKTKVSAMQVSDGLYERGSGRNVPEARAVVDEIHRMVMSDDGRSIGVIAFGVKQQTCISDMLEDRKEADSEFFERLEGMSEGVFVKNLETVQGDERDVILFSIGYGRSEDGKVYQNFGPLNRPDGWRRLNVAVSRARCEMVVFESMYHSDVRCTPDSGEGVRGLREFLRFAENDGRFDERDRAVHHEDVSSVADTIAAELRLHGYRCRFSVGSSSFRVDVAVVDPDDPGRYILGILSDGMSYGSSDNTRDREYARADVLMGLGWNLMHIWSAEWCFSRNKVLDRILKRVEDIVAERKAGRRRAS